MHVHMFIYMCVTIDWTSIELLIEFTTTIIDSQTDDVPFLIIILTDVDFHCEKPILLG
jgi:hypothetical protein